MKYAFLNKRKKVLKITFRIVLIVIAVVIVIFNDTFGKLEGFVEFLLLYFLVVFITISHWLFKQIRLIIRLKNEKTKTELIHLQSQVNPHFFFNTLNNLYGSVDKDSKARNIILKLSDMMRYSIYEGQKKWVTLEQEIKYLKNYIELQRLRYHKESDVQFDYKVSNMETQIMPLLFIILLENAFKHGLENLENNAYIHVHLSATENKIQFEIENNFEALKEQQTDGIGLKNLRRRLELGYPNKHVLTIRENASIYNAKLSLELQ